MGRFTSLKKAPTKSMLFSGAEDRDRTGTKFNPRRILSPVRLPVPPLRHSNLNDTRRFHKTVCISGFVKRIPLVAEPLFIACYGIVNDTRRFRRNRVHSHLICKQIKWMEVDSNHRSNLQQIYSLSPLATRESIHAEHYALTM